MVYLEFSSDLTEEELMLQEKYNKLRRKKKASQELKTPNPEPERVFQLPKSQRDTRDAREAAKKLIESGVIAATKTPKRPEESFKRSLGLKRKLNSSSEKTITSYQPFSETQSEEERQAKRSKVKRLSDGFAPSSDSADEVAEKPVFKPRMKPIKGNTIFVYGDKLSDFFLKEHFSRFGSIIHISTDGQKKGFITFEKQESAAEAITCMDGTAASSIELQVSMARKQPMFDPVNNATSGSKWASEAANYLQNPRKLHHRDTRDLQTYDDVFE